MKGFTFLEVILALALFTFGLLAITRMFGVSTQALQSGGNRMNAIFLAQEKMEALKSLPYAHMLDEDPDQDGNHTFQDSQGSIQRTWTIQKDQPMAGLSLLTVRATWREAGGVRTVSLVTLRAELGDGGE